MNLLIADDHPGVRTRISEIIKEAFPAAKLMVLPDGTKVLEQVASQRYDLVIMDIKMPGSSGLEVLRSLRSTSALPVIIISSHPEEQYSAAAISAGANLFICKQSMTEKLIPAIAALVSI
jgi:two-component system invasion response regulator UvrY